MAGMTLMDSEPITAFRAYHLDDDTECDQPSTCGRTVYWPGGRTQPEE